MEQRAAGGVVPKVVPSFGYHRQGIAAWGDAACIIPWNLYLYFGDASILQERYEDMKAWVDSIRRVDGDDHGWRKSYQYGDWLALDNPSRKADECRGGTDEGFIADVYYRQQRPDRIQDRRFAGQGRRRFGLSSAGGQNSGRDPSGVFFS